jgi:tripartite-type tricarboxylate transporter receptor subunit TctC
VRLIPILALLVGACAGTSENSAPPADATRGFPLKPVRLIEPFGSGGGVDTTSRAVAPKLSELWGQPVMVENRTGAQSTAAAVLVAKAAPDGYTLLVSSSAQAYAAALRKDLPYDPARDFVPVAPMTSQGYVLVAGKSAGIATLAQLIAAAKARPGGLRFGSPGVGSGSHFGALKVNLAAGIQAVHVPSDTIPEAIATAEAGNTDYLLAPVPLALKHIRSGDLVALGVSSARRSPLLPAVPTIAEAGLPGFDYSIWYGVWAPAGTPPAIVDKLAKDMGRALAMPELQEWVANHGGRVMNMTPAEFARFVASESESAVRLVASSANPGT